MDDERQVNRRRFFRAALGELLKPLEKKGGPLERALERMEQLGGAASPSPGEAEGRGAAPLVRAPAGRTAARGSDPFSRVIEPMPPGDGDAAGADLSLPVLRPPGAREEERFKSACTQCGECVVACPAHCIKVEPGGRGGGFPFIAALEMPCVVCDSLACMASCPTDALIPTLRAEIDMGTAEWHEESCVRSRREECTTCIDQCPMGSAALELSEGRIHVLPDGCIGCGVCEHFCPTFPRSITVRPRSSEAAR